MGRVFYKIVTTVTRSDLISRGTDDQYIGHVVFKE